MLTLIDSAEQFAQRISTFSHAEKRKTVLVPSMVHFDHFDRLAQVPSAHHQNISQYQLGPVLDQLGFGTEKKW